MTCAHWTAQASARLRVAIKSGQAAALAVVCRNSAVPRLNVSLQWYQRYEKEEGVR